MMKRMNVLIVLLLCMLSSTGFAENGADFKAKVTFIKGTVMILAVGSSSEEPAVLGRILHKGDRLTIGESSRVSMLLDDGRILVGKPGQTLTLGTDDAIGKPQLNDIARNIVTTLMTTPSDEAMMKHVGGLRESSTNLAISPRRTKVRYDRDIMFLWSPVASLKTWKLIVMAADGYFLEQTVTTGTSWALAAGTLKPGRTYYWEIHDGSRPDSMLSLGTGEFMTASEETTAELESLNKEILTTWSPTESAGDSSPIFIRYQFNRTRGLLLDALLNVLELEKRDSSNDFLLKREQELRLSMELEGDDLSVLTSGESSVAGMSGEEKN